MRLAANFASASLLVLTAVLPSGAQAQINQNQAVTTSDPLAYFYYNDDLVQSFKQSVNNIYGAGVFIGSGNGPKSGTVTIGLWDMLPNQFGATQIASASTFGVSGTWADVFWAPTAVTAGQTYYLWFKGPATFMPIAGAATDVYADGQLWGNSYTSFPTFDAAFRTYGVGPQGPPVDTVTPEPVTMTLLGTGLAGVAAARRRRKAAAA